MVAKRWVRFRLQAAAAALAALLIAAAWKAHSDEPAAADAPHRIPLATLDVAKAFKQDRDFNERLQHLKDKIDEYDREVRFRQAEIKKLTSQEVTSQATNNEAAKKAAYMNAMLQVDIATKKEEFLVAEARLYAERYQSLERAVAQICRRRDIGVVIRTSTEPLNPADREAVLQAVNRPIVYSSAPDLTDDAIAALNR